MNKDPKADFVQKTKSEGEAVRVLGSSILHVTDKGDNRARIRTLYDSSANATNQAYIDTNSDGFFSYSHPSYSGRQPRLDLISNHLSSVKLKVDDKETSLCDISGSGFSYAKKLAHNVAGDYYYIKNLIESSEKKLVGRKVKAAFQSSEKVKLRSIGISGTVRNVRLIYGLSLSEAELEFKRFLYKKTIHRANDKNNVYEKLEYLVDLVKQEIEKGNWGDSLAVSVNTTILNMMLEIGATSETIDKMYDGYKNRPMFIRFGASVDQKEQVQKLRDFTHNITAIYLKRRDEARRAAAQASGKFIENTKYRIPDIPIDFGLNYQRFLLKSWYGCLARFNLNPKKAAPKSNNKKLALHLKKEARAFHDVIDGLPHSQDKQMNLIAAKVFITECIYRALDSKESDEFDNVAGDIGIIVQKTYELCIQELAKKLEG